MDEGRRERLEQALRDNLKRRKAQSRAQQDVPTDKVAPDNVSGD